MGRSMAPVPLGVDIASVAAGGKDDRASVFPHGRNLNLLILVVVGASATASLIVGGLILALASRRRGVAKNVSKLQLSDDIEESGKLQQEWVALCGYEAEPSSTTVAFKAENKKKNRYPDKLPYDHNRVILNALVNATNSDYINASTVTDHDPRDPS